MSTLHRDGEAVLVLGVHGVAMPAEQALVAVADPRRLVDRELLGDSRPA